MIEQFHFQRVEWLLALIPLFIFSGLLIRKKLFSRSWKSVIDPQLLPHMLIGKPGKASRLPVILFMIAGLLSIFSLAGPAWEQLPQPVFKQQSALVIALDLSRSMDAADIKPSRLSRARYKISDILKQRKEGQTALIAYAGSAFTVTPLTDDADTIDSLISSLSTDIMPAQGSDTSSALHKAAELLKNAGISKGDIFLITDGIESAAFDSIEDIYDQGHRISVLAVGTEDGAPISLANGGFLKDDNGAIVIPKLDTKTLRSAAFKSAGRFSVLSSDDSDIKHLLGLLDNIGLDTKASETEMQADVWREEGPWLLLLLIPVVALAFRRGYLVILAALILPYPDTASALSWNELWVNDNQRALKQLEQGQHKQAAELFSNPEWKAAAQYKASDYQQAVETLNNIDNADAHYNRGNALAKLGKTQEAIDAYNQALQKDPEHEDAKYNKSLLEKQQEQEQQQNKQGEGENDNKEQSKDDQQQSSDSQQDSDNQDKKSSDNSQSDDNNNQDRNPSETDEQNKNKESPDEKQPVPEKNKSTDEQPESQQLSEAEMEQQDLSEQATKQWLRKIPDNPGELLRRKFKYQYNNQQSPGKETKPW
ncbi:MAG: VWA domain-containing protein [Gammaproteobacteria bacterium]|nr:VWA domain-containing protein [Gammaproteobacteria bacterium]